MSPQKITLKKLLILMSFFSSFYTTTAQNSVAISVLNKNQFAEAIQGKEVILVDVRTPEEYAEGFIEGAINIDYFDQQSFIKQISELDKKEPVYLYCRSGNRSMKAARQLVTLGFEKVYDLAGGYMSWSSY
jgi:rhodanese-related sulfurtransferase